MLHSSRCAILTISYSLWHAMLIPPLVQPLMLKSVDASLSKNHQPSIPLDINLVPDTNGVVQYNYGGNIGKVYNPKVVAVEGLRYWFKFQAENVTEAKKYFL